MRDFQKLLLLALLILYPQGLFSTNFLPLSEIRPGMAGVGRTVFSGTEIESFDVEILGVQERVGPKQDVILARLRGGPLESTGVIAGMSGSPVYVGDRLIGAIAYTWPFSKEAIVGITPIEQMNRVLERGTDRSRVLASGSVDLSPLFRPRSTFLMNQFWRPPRGRSSFPSVNAQPITLPLIFQGFPTTTIDHWSPTFRHIGFLTTQGGKLESPEDQENETVRPGDMIGVELVRGDLSIGAIGTVTSVEDEKLLAFGHPLLNLGQVDLPMSRAFVHTIVPSFYQSLKMASLGEEIGVLRQDRMSGALGILHQRARMIPVRVALENSGEGLTHYRYAIISHQQLTPLLLAITLSGILEAEVKAFGAGTFSVEGNIGLSDYEDVLFDDLFSGEAAQHDLIAQLGGILYVLYNNGLTIPEISGIALHIRHSELLSKAKLTEIWFDNDQVIPGEPLAITLFLDPYGGERIRHETSIQIPETLYGKNVLLRVSDAEGMRGLETPTGEVRLQQLESLIKIINSLRTNKNIYASLYVPQASYFIDGNFLTSLPPSLLAIITSARSQQDFLTFPVTILWETTIETDYVINGSKELPLQILTSAAVE